MSVAPHERAPVSPVSPVSIDADIDFIAEQIDRLKELGRREEPGDVYGDEDVYDLSVRWGTALAGRLPRMAHYSSCGLLDDAAEGRFQSLCAELRAVAPLVDRFKLATPDLEGKRTTRKRRAQRSRRR